MDLWTFDPKHEKLVKKTTKNLYKHVLSNDAMEHQDKSLSTIEDINQLYDLLYSLSIHCNHDRVGLLWKIIQTLTTHLENQMHTSKNLEKQTKTLQQLLHTTESMLETATHMDTSPRKTNGKYRKDVENGTSFINNNNQTHTILFNGSPAIRGSTESFSNYSLPPALRDSTSSQSSNSTSSSPLLIPKGKPKLRDTRASAFESVSSVEDATSPHHARRRAAVVEPLSTEDEISFDTLSAYKIPTK